MWCDQLVSGLASVWHNYINMKTLFLHGGRVESAKSFAIHFEVVACVIPCKTMLCLLWFAFHQKLAAIKEQHVYIEFCFILTNSYRELQDISTVFEEGTLSKTETFNYHMYPNIREFFHGLSCEKWGLPYNCSQSYLYAVGIFLKIEDCEGWVIFYVGLCYVWISVSVS
jgi:hypothetical protein